MVGGIIIKKRKEGKLKIKGEDLGTRMVKSNQRKR